MYGMGCNGIISSLEFPFCPKRATARKTGNRGVRSAYKPYFFSQRTIFLFHNKSANSTFSHGLLAKRTIQKCLHRPTCQWHIVRTDGVTCQWNIEIWNMHSKFLRNVLLKCLHPTCCQWHNYGQSYLTIFMCYMLRSFVHFPFFFRDRLWAVDDAIAIQCHDSREGRMV